jgi:hypothetical protein
MRSRPAPCLRSWKSWGNEALAGAAWKEGRGRGPPFSSFCLDSDRTQNPGLTRASCVRSLGAQPPADGNRCELAHGIAGLGDVARGQRRSCGSDVKEGCSARVVSKDLPDAQGDAPVPYQVRGFGWAASAPLCIRGATGPNQSADSDESSLPERCGFSSYLPGSSLKPLPKRSGATAVDLGLQACGRGREPHCQGAFRDGQV